MNRTLLIVSGVGLALLQAVFAVAQETPENTQSAAAILVTATVSSERVRFAAPNRVAQLRLEVYAENGQRLFDSEQRGGNVLDWHLQDGTGAPLTDAAYLCLLTIKDLSGRLRQTLASVQVDAQTVTLQPIASGRLTTMQAQAVGPVEQDVVLKVIDSGAVDAATVIAHDGRDGQLTRTRGALTFRIGDFFSGNDKEQMRLTEDGNLGIGTSKPEVKLDVAGAIRAREGFVFNDGSTLNVNGKGALTLSNSDRKSTLTLTNDGGTVTPNVAGTGTQNYIAKWAETGGAGTLQNSGIFETAGGNIGVGTASPANKLDIVRGTAGQMAKSYYEMSSFEYDADAKFGVYSSATSSNPSAALTFGSTNLQVNGKFPGFELQYVYGNTAASSQSRFNYVEREANGRVANFAANLLTINGNGDVTLNPINLGVTASPRLSIGTASPDAPLTVVGAGATLPTAYNSGNVATFVAPNDSFNAVSIAKGGVANPQGLVFGVNQASLYSEIQSSHMGIAPNALVLNRQGGNVGIGTNNPQALLDVAGTINTLTQFNIGGNRVLSVAGTNNLFAGAGAGQANTVGTRNAFFGFNAGHNNVGDNFGNGSDNAFFGSSAGSSNTGQQNSFVGSGAGAGNTSGSFNSFFGEAAGLNNTTGGFNTFIGSNTGFSSAGPGNTSGTNDTALGLGAMIGLDAGNNNVTNATAIGANAFANRSNTLVLGSIHGINGATDDTFVGIGTTDPISKLEIAGPQPSLTLHDTFGGNKYAFMQDINGDAFLFSNNRRLLVLKDGSGNVGIGTSNPSQQLHVSSGTGNAATLVQTPTGSFAQYQLQSGATNPWIVGTQDNFNNNALLFRNGSTDLLKLQPDGNLSQLPAANGLVKAMLLVNDDGSINLCYNSQLTGAAATTLPCGFSVIRNAMDSFDITFPFQINSRFFSAMTGDFGCGGGHVTVQPTSTTNLGVYISSTCNNRFYLLVF